MKYFLVFLAIFFSVTAVNAQITLEPDTLLYPTYPSLLNKVNSAYKLDKNNTFEVRLWIHHELMRHPFLFILSQKDSVWKTRYFEFKKQANDFVPTEKVIKNKDVGALWKLLEYNGLETLPNCDQLKDSSGNEASMRIIHSVLYNFEIINGNKYQMFTYQCPKAHGMRYPYIKEFERAANITDAILRFCKISRRFRC